MRTFGSLEAFVTHLARLPEEMRAAEKHGREDAGKFLVKEAQALIGEEQDAWPALADSTIAAKSALGQTGRISATDPLFATGEMRDSIGFSLDDGSMNLGPVEQTTLRLGSTDQVAPYHEFGTEKMPPRPFIGATMFKHGREAAKHVAHHMVAAFAGEPPPRSKV